MPLSKPLRHLLAISLMTLMHPLTVVAEDVPERSQVEDQYKWDLTDMYRDASAWAVSYTHLTLPTIVRV